METCSLSDFMKVLNPWLDAEHIRRAYLDGNGHFVLMFQDGATNVYQIDDCNQEQLRTVLEDLELKGINVQR